MDLSIIIVNANSRDFLKKCLNSLKGSTKKITSEIIVVDNDSSDGSVEMIEKDFPRVKLIQKYKKRGFGANNNFGIKVAKGKYILLLNPDTEIVDKNTFKEMIEWMNKHPKAGLASCALLNPDKKTYQGSGGYFPTLTRVFAWMTFLDDIPFVDTLVKPYHPLHGWSPFYKGEDYFKKSHEQDWVTGAYYLIRKEALDEVGVFDEDFFLYVEEVELSYRIKKAGWEVWYLPKWVIVHYGQSTTSSESAMVNELKNLKLFYKKHYPTWKMPILSFLIKIGTLLRIVFFGLWKGGEVAKVYVKAFKEA